MSRRSTRPRFTSALAIEPLEARAVPASVALNNGVLTIQGDGANDNALVEFRDGGVYVEVASTAGGDADRVTRSYASDSVRSIRFFGSDGDDRFVSNLSRPCFADGGGGNDYLEGADAADDLWGRAGNDTLIGHGGSDNLYGGSDDDLLQGMDGLDGLYGGAGTDALFGGRHADRFLVLSGFREHRDAARPDAVVLFRNDARTWIETEIEQLDEGLKLLHRRTGNDNLLETSAGRKLTFVRGGDRGNTLAINHGGTGRITVYDGAFESTPLAAVTAIHEVGHNWDTRHGRWNNWLALSGWRKSAPPRAQADLYARSGDGRWWHLRGARFTRGYGQESPREDWSTAWESYFISRHNLPNAVGVSPLSGAKTAHLDAFFAALS